MSIYVESDSATFDSLLFSLVPGRHHSAEHFKYLQEELAKLGISSLAVNLDIEDSSLSLDDHAEALFEAERATGYEHFGRIGHSWAANIVPRHSELVEILFFLSGVFHPSTLPAISPELFPEVKHSAGYEIIKRDPDHNLKGLAADVFYQDLLDDPEDLEKLHKLTWAIDLLRPHPRREQEPPLEQKPNIPAIFIQTKRDNTVQFHSQGEMAEAYGATAVPFEGDHGSMISHPQELALLVEQAVVVTT